MRDTLLHFIWGENAWECQSCSSIYGLYGLSGYHDYRCFFRLGLLIKRILLAKPISSLWNSPVRPSKVLNACCRCYKGNYVCLFVTYWPTPALCPSVTHFSPFSKWVTRSTESKIKAIFGVHENEYKYSKKISTVMHFCCYFWKFAVFSNSEAARLLKQNRPHLLLN